MKARKIRVTVSNVCIIMVLFLFSLVYSQTCKGQTLFDNAIEWKPYEIMTVQEGCIYKFTFEQKQKVDFYFENMDGIDDHTWYDANGVSFGLSSTTNSTYIGPPYIGSDYGKSFVFNAGTYFLRVNRVSGKNPQIWYAVSNPSSSTALVDNITGSAFEGISSLEAMQLYSQEDSNNMYKNIKIVITEACKFAIHYDEADDCYLLNSSGLLVGKKKHEQTFNLEPGTYFLRLYGKVTNLYYTITNPDQATNVTLNRTNAVLQIGETIQLNYFLLPAKCIDTVTWRSGDINVAKVDESGEVTAVGIGECLVIATSSSGRSAACTITVKNSSKNDNIVSKKKTNITIKKGNKIINSVVIKKGKSATLKVKASSKGKLLLSKLTKKQKKIASVTLKRGKIKIKGKKKGRISLKITSAKTFKCKKATKTIKIFIK